MTSTVIASPPPTNRIFYFDQPVLHFPSSQQKRTFHKTWFQKNYFRSRMNRNDIGLEDLVVLNYIEGKISVNCARKNLAFIEHGLVVMSSDLGKDIRLPNLQIFNCISIHACQSTNIKRNVCLCVCLCVCPL